MPAQQTAMDLVTRSMNVIHNALQKASGGRVGKTVFGMKAVQLHTTGKRSGQRRTVWLTSPVYSDERIVLIASKGGDDRHPDWYHNITANPDVEITEGEVTKPFTARTATPAEKADLWPQVIEAYKGYAGYQKRTERDIPVVICEPQVTEYQLLIGGERVGGDAGGYEVVNPSTEQVIAVAPEASVAQVEAAAAAASDAFPAWSRTKPEERADLLNRAADLLRDRMDELIPLVQAETGATQRVASTMQVPTCIERFRRYAKGALEPATIPLPPSEMPATALASGGLMGAMVVRQPVGVVACITPYNFPIVNMAGKIGPALAMGNTIVVKPAPQDPLAVTVFGQILQDAGFPDGVVNVVTGSSPEAGQALVASPHVDMVSFTGSTPVGRAIGEAAGRDMKRLLLELGGKGAGIVFDDADLKNAIGTIASVWAFHSGQICTAPTRVIAQRGVYDQVVAGLQAAAGRLKVGDPLEPDTVVGPLISAVQRDRVEALIQTGVEQGGELIAGGERPAMDAGFYVAPTLLAGCKPDNAAVQQEFFGPVVVVVPFDDEDEAVTIANGTEFGLYDYVFSADTTRCLRVAKQLRTGNVGLNTAQRNHEAPFGGFKMSGVGRDGGSFGLHAYSELQSIVWPG